MSVLQNGLFGCLVTHRQGELVGFNGLQSANQSFLKAIIRYSEFSELHLFLASSDLASFQSQWQSYFDTFGSDKVIRLVSINRLPDYFSQYRYAVFHSGDPYISDLVALRDHHSPKLFPIVGRAHTLSDDSRLSRMRDLVMSPVKSCDVVLCSSRSQQQVMKRLLSAASASISDSLGIALPYRGRLETLALGLEQESECHVEKSEARSNLNLPQDKKIILCLGRLSPFDKMDLHPLLHALNDIVEEYRVEDFLLVIAGGGDGGGSYVQSLLKRAYELNLEDQVRFELSVDDAKKHQLYRAADIFVSLSDNVQESFGLTPLEAMRDEVPVVLSDWDGYRELVEHDVSGCLIPTVSINNDDINRSLNLLHAPQARLLEAQSVSVDADLLVATLHRLMVDDAYRIEVAKKGRQRFVENFSWPGIIASYQDIVAALDKEALSVSYRQGRLSGMSYHNVFGHYASSQLESEQMLTTTDRGLRVLLQSEHGFHFSELNDWLNQAQIYALLERCVQPVKMMTLESEASQASALRFVLAWMLKYQLLQKTDKAEESPRQGKIIRALDSSQHYTLSYPEQRRAPFLQPFLLPCMDRLSDIIGADDNRDSLLQTFGNELVRLLDSSLLQAIGWFAKSKKLQAYGEVLEALEAAGGVRHLVEVYPLWYRTRRTVVFRYLRAVKSLLRRVRQDVEVINKAFGFIWESKAGCLAGVEFFAHHHQYSVFLLSFDNGEKLVYKSRDMRIDRALAGSDGELVNRVNQWLSGIRIETHQILCQQEQKSGKTLHYGYAQYLDGDEQIQTLSLEEAKNYYRQSGSLLAYSLLTGLADLHPQNLVSHNAALYLVDAKTAFHRGVFQRLVNELKQPDVAFLRGLSGSSFEESELYRLWQDFHTAEVNYCSVKLVNGELLDAEPQVFFPLTRHLFKVDGRSVLDSADALSNEDFVDDITSGFADVVNAIAEHAEDFKELLAGLRGFYVRHQPFINIAEVQKLLRDVYTADALQLLSVGRIESFVDRLARRVTLSGEVGQRWLEPEWQEPVSSLDDAVARSCLKLELPSFCCQLGEKNVALSHSDGSIKSIDEAYFAGDALLCATGLIDDLANEEVRKRFVEACQAVLSDWFGRQLIPGKELPDEIRQSIDSQLRK